MDLVITPDASPEEREAILRALAAHHAAHPSESEWWRRGLEEALGVDDAEVAL